MSFRISPAEQAYFYPAPPAGGQITEADLIEVEELMELFDAPENAAAAARIIGVLAVMIGAYSAWSFARWGARWQSGQRLDEARRIAAGTEEATREVIKASRAAARQHRFLTGV